MEIKRILVSQPEPSSGKSPYHDLAKKFEIQVDFRQFIEVTGVNSKEFRQQKVNIIEHNAVIFTSRTAINHFFRMCEALRIKVEDDMKYFCTSESVALFLQKYIVYRKRKIFFSKKGVFADLLDVMEKHRDCKFLLPLSDPHKKSIPDLIKKKKFKFTEGIFYRTISSDLSDLNDVNYDVLVFFSPTGISSLLENFPDFVQDTTQIAAFGPATAKAVEEAGLRLDIKAPTPKMPSMSMALDKHLKEQRN